MLNLMVTNTPIWASACTYGGACSLAWVTVSAYGLCRNTCRKAKFSDGPRTAPEMEMALMRRVSSG